MGVQAPTFQHGNFTRVQEPEQGPAKDQGPGPGPEERPTATPVDTLALGPAKSDWQRLAMEVSDSLQMGLPALEVFLLVLPGEGRPLAFCFTPGSLLLSFR